MSVVAVVHWPKNSSTCLNLVAAELLAKDFVLGSPATIPISAAVMCTVLRFNFQKVRKMVKLQAQGNCQFVSRVTDAVSLPFRSLLFNHLCDIATVIIIIYCESLTTMRTTCSSCHVRSLKRML